METHMTLKLIAVCTVVVHHAAPTPVHQIPTSCPQILFTECTTRQASVDKPYTKASGPPWRRHFLPRSQLTVTQTTNNCGPIIRAANLLDTSSTRYPDQEEFSACFCAKSDSSHSAGSQEIPRLYRVLRSYKGTDACFNRFRAQVQLPVLTPNGMLLASGCPTGSVRLYLWPSPDAVISRSPYSIGQPQGGSSWDNLQVARAGRARSARSRVPRASETLQCQSRLQIVAKCLSLPLLPCGTPEGESVFEGVDGFGSPRFPLKRRLV
ncbi:hypothetical protein JB92DRAFT_1036533 [Gautieria morchelliformis]|nr:hypothetical protein JB92DRAFT_1036533 [Gautieria morchelliformis]